MKHNYSFVTFLGTDNFLPGVIALSNSLKKYNKTYGLLVLLTDLVSTTAITALDSRQIKHKFVDRIQNPNDLGDDERSFGHMYTKLRIFELEEFDKIVYIDADMLVCQNIEELFDAPHLSAVIAGALNPECSHWKHLNAGFLVLVPNRRLATGMYSKIADTPSNDGSDQGFLHSFYRNWPNEHNLHLDHKYNVPVYDIEIYCKVSDFRFNYKNGVLDTNISIIHYWGYHKPWHHKGSRQLNIRSRRAQDEAFVLWWDMYKPGQRNIRILNALMYTSAKKFLSLFRRN